MHITHNFYTQAGGHACAHCKQFNEEPFLTNLLLSWNSVCNCLQHVHTNLACDDKLHAQNVNVYWQWSRQDKSNSSIKYIYASTFF